MKAIAYSEIIDIDWRKDERDGKYKILDCNPRVGQNFRMFQDDTGLNVIRAQHLDLSGRPANHADMIEGRRFVVKSFYLMALLRRASGGVSKRGIVNTRHMAPARGPESWHGGAGMIRCPF